MKNLIAILALLIAFPAYGQTELKQKHRAQDQDKSLCVNDGGVEKCLTIDGPTAAVSVPADFSVTGIMTSGEISTTQDITTTGDVSGTRNYSFQASGTGLNSGSPSATIFTPSVGQFYFCLSKITGGAGVGANDVAVISMAGTTIDIDSLDPTTIGYFADDGSGNVRIQSDNGSTSSFVYSCFRMR